MVDIFLVWDSFYTLTFTKSCSFIFLLLFFIYLFFVNYIVNKNYFRWLCIGSTHNNLESVRPLNGWAHFARPQTWPILALPYPAILNSLTIGILKSFQMVYISSNYWQTCITHCSSQSQWCAFCTLIL